MTSQTVIGVYGASGFGREVMPLVRSQAAARKTEVQADLVFVDDSLAGTTMNGHRVVGYAEFLTWPNRFVSIAIANSAVRERLARQCEADGIHAYSIRSGTAEVLDENAIGAGAILCAYTIVTSNARIGDYFHANIYSYVAHDCVVGNFVTLAPGAKVNGNVVIEDHAYIGTGAIIKQGSPGQPTRIGHSAVVGMGAVVTKDVPSGVTVVGNPARQQER